MVIPLVWRKSLTWSLLAFTITVTVTYLVTRELHVSATVGAIERCIKLVAYPLHETLYEKPNLQSRTPVHPHSQTLVVGKKRDPEAES